MLSDLYVIYVYTIILYNIIMYTHYIFANKSGTPHRGVLNNNKKKKSYSESTIAVRAYYRVNPEATVGFAYDDIREGVCRSECSRSLPCD